MPEIAFAWQLCDRLPSPNGESAVDCDNLSSMPNVSFTIGGKVFDLAPNQVWFYADFKHLSAIWSKNDSSVAPPVKEFCI